jgi:hypothetical protein
MRSGDHISSELLDRRILIAGGTTGVRLSDTALTLSKIGVIAGYIHILTIWAADCVSGNRDLQGGNNLFSEGWLLSPATI